MAEKITTNLILSYLKEKVEAKKQLPKEVWMDAAFKLNLLLADEHYLLEQLRQDVARKKLEIMKGQEKRNISAVDMEVNASDENRFFKLQEHKVDRVEEFIRIAKKNSNEF